MTHDRNLALPLTVAVTLATLASAPGITYAQQTSDALFKYQWHLRNIGQTVPADTKPTYGIDLGIDDLHRHNIRGNGVTIAIVDDGLEIAHPDLAPNVAPIAGYNFANRSNNPTPANLNTAHGTNVGGIAGAAGYNGRGVRGVAPAATLKGFNLLESSVTYSDANIEYAWFDGREVQDVDVFNNSWGLTFSNAVTNFPFSRQRQHALEQGMRSTRSGKGGIYVKAAGNSFKEALVNSPWGAKDICSTDSVRFRVGCVAATSDPRNSLFNVITVGAVAADGKRSSYSSVGPNLWVSAFGGEYGFQTKHVVGKDDAAYRPGIVTTDTTGCDKGANRNNAHGVIHVVNDLDGAGSTIDASCNYTARMWGTSAAAPMVSGVAALMLEANPHLTYRDVKYILATTARRIDPDLPAATHTDGRVLSPGWTENAAKRYFSNAYGFGLVDASAAVVKAADFKPLSNLIDTGWQDATVATRVAIGRDSAAAARIILPIPNGPKAVESVQLGFTVSHPAARELQFVLVSPSGTRNVVQPAFTALTRHVFNVYGLAGVVAPVGSWDLVTSNAFLDERGSGDWVLEVTDMGLAAGGRSRGTVDSFNIRVLGH